MPLVTFDTERDANLPPPTGPPPSYAAAHDEEEEGDAPPRRWYHYFPTCVTVSLLLAPHPSLLKVLVNYHLRVLHNPLRFTIHLGITYLLSFLAFSSLIAIIVRDPGRVGDGKTHDSMDGDADGEELNLTQALLSTNDHPDISSPGKWCRKCWAPKPERTHHCSHCGRCVLKMDHHCGWLGYKCLGHRTYTSFLHFLFCIVLFAMYIASLCISAVYFAFTNPLAIDESTPLHEMSLALAGIIVTMVIGPFLLYHVYLVSTNQTTLEHLSPFLLLRELPPLPRHASDRFRLSNPPLEHELSNNQRRLVRDAHGHIRLYDVGWRRNWAQVLGWDRPWGWLYRIAIGGGGKGDGSTFSRNPKADELLARLASEIVDVDKVL